MRLPLPSRAAVLALASAALAGPAPAQDSGAGTAHGIQALASRVALIQHFAVSGEGPLRPGRTLHFRLQAVPGATARVEIPGVTGGIGLRETRSGLYEGSYIVRPDDELAAFDEARALLRFGEQRAVARAAIGPALRG